ncbi:hypothetical protein SK854_05585 [Lentzea sp. BCCO 10_0061]|uniref:Uncharacterized protein n=1 Tax=Lentzea sokolovensis TaxID=3095429 RepID=A0ABU4US87_9PSEU|nr:hypothetical protein [Lentzea sp. BCCO 10_0061]MDX8141575.1 hypothetical protein [Lentzea sp. BCCO 10_0061]
MTRQSAPIAVKTENRTTFQVKRPELAITTLRHPLVPDKPYTKRREPTTR